MTIDQKFQKKPTTEVTLRLLEAFGIKGFNKNKTFSKLDMEKIDTVGTIESFVDELRPFYIPCKRELFLDNLNDKKAITILRHFLKHSGHYLSYHETYIKRKKYMLYNLITLEKHKINILKKTPDKDIKFIVSFS